MYIPVLYWFLNVEIFSCVEKQVAFKSDNCNFMAKLIDYGISCTFEKRFTNINVFFSVFFRFSAQKRICSFIPRFTFVKRSLIVALSVQRLSQTRRIWHSTPGFTWALSRTVVRSARGSSPNSLISSSISAPTPVTNPTAALKSDVPKPSPSFQTSKATAAVTRPTSHSNATPVTSALHTKRTYLNTSPNTKSPSTWRRIYASTVAKAIRRRPI